MSSSSQRVVIITGCSPGGLGHALCKEFLAKDWRVFATARNVDSIKSLEADGCDILTLDVTKPESISVAANELSVKTGGRLDVLVNNAGVMNIAPAMTEDPADVRSAIETNLLGPILVTQAFVPIIIKSNNGKGGVIVNVSSAVVVTPLPWSATYNASKAGLDALSRSWRMELKNFGIQVIDVVGGWIGTRGLDATASSASEGDSGTQASTLYWNWGEIDAQRRKAVNGYKSSSPADVARDIVAAASKKSPPLILYTGSGAWLCKYLPHYPTSWIDWLVGRQFGASLVSHRS